MNTQAQKFNPVLDDPSVIQELKQLDPDFGDLAVRMAGEVWGRGGLSNRERAFLSIASDVVNQTLQGPFQFHVKMALENGATRSDVKEAILHLAIYASFPKTLQAIDALNKIYAEIDRAEGRMEFPGVEAKT